MREGGREPLTFLVTMKETVPPWSMMAFLSRTFFLNGRDESRSSEIWTREKIPMAAWRALLGSLERKKWATVVQRQAK